MSNIIGEGLDKEIIDQIATRQRALSKSVLGDNDLLWYHSKTAWVRLASSVNVDGSDRTAKDYVLFGGKTKYTEEDSVGVGPFGDTINYTDKYWSLRDGFSDNDNSSYEKTQFGYKPVPHIIEIKSDDINGGHLRIVEVRIKVYSPEQLEIIDKLYLRPGFSVLLEWGNTVYLDNKGDKKLFSIFSTKPFEYLFLGKSANLFNTAIKEERLKHCGNYDASRGIISKGVWNFNSDGSYDITMQFSADGYLLETFDIGNSLSSENDKKENSPTIEFSKDITLINRFLNDITTKPEALVKRIYNLTDINSKIIKKEFKGNRNWLWTRQSNIQHYISLSGLLEYLDKNRNIYSKSEKYFNYDYELETNLCLTFPEQFSSDPNVCIIPINNVQSELSNFRVADNPFVGRLMSILINVNFLFSILIELRKNNGAITLFDFLKEILTRVNNALGNQNKLELVYDSEDNVIRIWDNIPLNYGNFKKNKETAELNLFGLGTFVKDINFDVSFSKEFSNMVSIGASEQGNQPGINATAISQYNKGLVDRTMPEKNTTRDIVSTNIDDVLKYSNTSVKINAGLKELYVNKILTEDTIKTLESLNNDYFKYLIGRYTTDNNIPAPFMLPFNLKLTLDGLSGFKNRRKINISPNSIKLLPAFYRDNNNNPIIDILINNISHVVSNNKWTTIIETYAAPIASENKPPTIFQAKTSVIKAKQEPTQYYEEASCEQDATIKISDNYNLAQVSCKALTVKEINRDQYKLPASGAVKTTPRGTFTRDQIINNLKSVAINVLEPIRKKWPTVLVTSGYRNKGDNSQHEVGEAIDIQFSDITGTVAQQNEAMLQRAKDIKALLNSYDQFLLEYKTTRGGRPWIHISFKQSSNRGEASTFLDDKYASNGRNQFYNPLA